MNKTTALLAAGVFALSTAAFAQTAAPAKPADKPAAAAATAPAMAKMDKPASLAQADWDKMTDAQKKDAIEKAKKAAPAKKEKKGGC